MKRLFIALSSVLMTSGLFAQGNQCPGCTIDPACNNPAANFPALCPDVLPNGTAGQSYSENITFYMPYIIDAEGFSGLHLEEVTVLGISGIPSGLFWTTDHYPTNYYDVTTDPNTQRGCVTICGTPALPGSYNASVSVLVNVCNVPVIGCTTMTQTFVLPLTIDAPAGGNPYFTFNPSSGCGSVDVTFDALVNVGSPQVTEYVWDFDNGDSAFVQHPQVQTYGTPGEYHPTLFTNIYNHVLNALQVTSITGNWWNSEFGDEGTFGTATADIQFSVAHGSATYTAAEIANNNTPSWNNLGVILENLTISLTFWENDALSANDQGGSFAFVVPGPGVYNFSTTTTDVGYTGGLNGNFTITKELFNSLSATDTLTVYNLPPLPIISSSSGSFNMCSTSPITLSVYGGYAYEWFLNDTTLLVGYNDSSYTVPEPIDLPLTSTYKVRVTDTLTGCSVYSPSITVVINEGIVPAFSSTGAMYLNGVLKTNYTYPSYQWLLNGTPIVPAGQTQSFTPTVNGNYSLVVTNQFGCSDTSNVIAIYNVGIDESSILQQLTNVYPNPSNGEFTCSVDLASPTSLSISVVDLSGKTVYAEFVGMVNGQFTKSFNLQHLSSGIYTLNLSFEEGTVRKKIIIR